MRLLLAVLLGIPIACAAVAIVYFLMFIGWVLLVIGIAVLAVMIIYTGLQKVPEDGNKKSP